MIVHVVSTAVCEPILDVDALDDDALLQLLRDSEADRRRREAFQAAVIAEIDRRRLWRHDGHASVYGLVRVVTQRPTYEITQLVQTAALMADEPVVADALFNGDLGVAQVHGLAKARAHPRCGDELSVDLDRLLHQALSLSFSEFTTRVECWVNTHDMDGADQKAAACHARRDVFFHVYDGEFYGTIHGGALSGAGMKEILERFADAEFDKDWAWTLEHHGHNATPSLMPRTAPQRRFDALEAMAMASVSTPPGAQPPEPVVNLICDPVTFATILARYLGLSDPPEPPQGCAGVERHCETTDGVTVAPVEVLAALLLGHVRRVVQDSQGVVIDMGRRMRLFSGNARIAAHLGLMRCIWAGCEIPASRCHTDHLTNWAHGGHTRPHDGAPCCPRHNQWKNRGYQVTRDPHGHFHTWRPDGTEIG